ncbi:MAG: hypothetical protein HYX76_02830 [Acidobacteria bacterium]|nr:hypothetical protein [Acidobacteriota bacterium]
MAPIDQSRRTFAAALGGLLLAPALLESAVQELNQSGKISRETLTSALRLTGDALTEEQINRTSPALEMLINDFAALRKVSIPPGVEPAVRFYAAARVSTAPSPTRS